MYDAKNLILQSSAYLYEAKRFFSEADRLHESRSSFPDSERFYISKQINQLTSKGIIALEKSQKLESESLILQKLVIKSQEKFWLNRCGGSE